MAAVQPLSELQQRATKRRAQVEHNGALVFDSPPAGVRIKRQDRAELLCQRILELPAFVVLVRAMLIYDSTQRDWAHKRA